LLSYFNSANQKSQASRALETLEALSPLAYPNAIISVGKAFIGPP
jgi:hypothetical protein